MVPTGALLIVAAIILAAVGVLMDTSVASSSGLTGRVVNTGLANAGFLFVSGSVFIAASLLRDAITGLQERRNAQGSADAALTLNQWGERIEIGGRYFTIGEKVFGIGEGEGVVTGVVTGARGQMLLVNFDRAGEKEIAPHRLQRRKTT
jgi:hypothetical protein